MKNKMPIVQHLVELRSALLRSIIAIALFFAVLFPFSEDIYSFIAAPILAVIPGSNLIAIGVISPFLTPLKMSLILAIYLFFSVRKFFYENDKFIYYLIIIKIIGLTYFLGEEMSWGQHIFKWESPDFFMNLNNQKEANLHNMSNFFDQIPRSLVLLWCCFSIITIKFVNKLRKVNKFLFIFINPNRNILLISLLLIFFLAPDFIIDKFDLHPGYKDSLSYDQIIFDLKKGLFSTYMHDSLFYDLISFKFIRLSELHELIIAFYFFIHSYSLKKEIRTVH